MADRLTTQRGIAAAKAELVIDAARLRDDALRYFEGLTGQGPHVDGARHLTRLAVEVAQSAARFDAITETVAYFAPEEQQT